MRVLICATGMAALTPAEAGAAVGRAFAAPGVDVAVVPLADPGPDLDAVLHALGFEPVAAGVARLGVTLVLDLTRLGRDEVAAAIASAGADDRLVGVVPAADVGGERPGLSLAGAGGAARGLAAPLLRAGGTLASAPGLLGRLTRLEETLGRADLVVAAVRRFDVGSHGGDVVPWLAALTDGAAVPLIVLAEAVDMSRREMRANGIEAAHAVATTDAASLEAAARRVAAGWTTPPTLTGNTAPGVSG